MAGLGFLIGVIIAAGVMFVAIKMIWPLKVILWIYISMSMQISKKMLGVVF